MVQYKGELQTVQQPAHTTHIQLQKQKLQNYLEVPSQMLIKLKYGSYIPTPAAPPQVKLVPSRCKKRKDHAVKRG